MMTLLTDICDGLTRMFKMSVKSMITTWHCNLIFVVTLVTMTLVVSVKSLKSMDALTTVIREACQSEFTTIQ
jgi:hypothetical protein